MAKAIPPTNSTLQKCNFNISVCHDNIIKVDNDEMSKTLGKHVPKVNCLSTLST